MNYLVSASTDVGIKKKTNQDSLSIKVFETSVGKIVFAVLCDGMGGLSKGELASATVVKAFSEWAVNNINIIADKGIEEFTIRNEWESLILLVNEKIINYGKKNHVELGTTVTAMLMAEERYYVLNVGDSRTYEITEQLTQITEDQTVIAHEIKMGRLTVEEAQKDPRRNVLLQCVGASNLVCPEFFFGKTKKNAVYMLCSDGFRHEISESEILSAFNPYYMTDTGKMKAQEEYLINLNKQRMENDNISVITIRTF